MPRQLDPGIAEILRKYGEDPTDTKNVLWDCHGTWVVYHRAVERIAAKAGVKFDPPTIIRADRDEAVILVSGEFENRRDWDIGECVLNVNYRVSARQAAYVWAMAMKRARDRLVLKLIGLHGLLYSEEEADELKSGRPAENRNGSEPEYEPEYEPREQVMQRAIETGQPVEDGNGVVTAESAIERKVGALRNAIETSKKAITIRKWMDDPRTDDLLQRIDEDEAFAIRSRAWVRIAQLEAQQ